MRTRPIPAIHRAALFTTARIRDSAASSARIERSLHWDKRRTGLGRSGVMVPSRGSVRRLDAGDELLDLRVLGVLLVNRLHGIDEGLLVDIVDLAAARPDLLFGFLLARLPELAHLCDGFLCRLAHRLLILGRHL